MDTTVEPVVSVILPVYNAMAYLDEALASIRAQSFSSFELIALNDGSTDDSGKILARHALEDTRIVLVSHAQNQGLIATLNEGFSLAKGRYIARMDADDISLPQRFEKQVQFLDAHPDCFCVGGWYAHYPSGRVQKLALHDHQIKVDILHYNPMAHPLVMLRRSHWMQHTLRYESAHKHVEDLALWLTCMSKGLIFANLPEVLLKYRRHSAQISEVHQRLQENAALTLRASYLAGLLHLPNEKGDLKSWVDTSLAPSGDRFQSFMTLSKAFEQYALGCNDSERSAWLRFLQKHYILKVRMLSIRERKLNKHQVLSHAPASMTWLQRAKLYLM